MKDTHYHSVVNNSPAGYAHNEIILDKNGKAVGYKILDANKSFELMTGINFPEIKGKNVYDIFPDIEKTGLDSLKEYSKVAEKGGSISLDKYFLDKDIWFRIHVTSEQKDHFITYFTDISGQKSGIVDNEEILNLTKTLLDKKGDIPDYDKLVSEICRLSGSDFGVFNIYSEDRKKFTNKSIFGKSKMIQAAYKLLGFSLANKEWEISQTHCNEIKRGHLVRFENLAELAKGVIPEGLCKTISNLTGVGSVYVVEISAHGKILGDFILIFRKGAEIKNRSSVAAFANLVGIAINRKKDEEKIQNSENNLNNFFNAGIDFHWVLDNNGYITTVNETVIKRLGYSEEELIGQNVLNVHPEEKREEAGRIIEAILKGEDVACHIPLLTKSGELIPVETFVIQGEWNGKPSLFGVSKDISALKLSEEKFYKAFNTSPNIMGLSTLDTGVFVEINKAFCDILGYSQEEVIGKKSTDILNLSPQFRKIILEQLKREGHVRNVETTVNTKSGAPINVLLSAEILRTQDKEYNLTVGVDITSLKKIQESLKQSESKYRALTERMSDILWTCDLQFNATWVSPSVEKMLGFTPDERLKQKVEEITTPASLRDAYSILSKELEADKDSDPDRTLTIKMEYYHKNGSLKILENGLSFIRDTQGKPVGIQGISRDITERHRAEEELLRANELLEHTGLMAKVGAWEVNFINGTVFWTDVLRKIMHVPDEFEPGLDNILSFYKEGESRNRIQLLVDNSKITGDSFDEEFLVIDFLGVEHWIRNIVKPVFRNGECLKVVGTFQDITDRKIAENKIKESEANLKAIIENTLENIWSVNKNYEIQYVNEVFSKAFQQTFGTELKVGRNIIEALPDKYCSIWKERYDRAFLNEHFLFEDKVEAGPQTIYIEVAMNPIIVDGKVEGVSLYGKDVTDKKLAQIQLQYQADLRKLLVELSSSFINLPVNEIEPAIYNSLSRIGEFVGADRAYVFDYDFKSKTSSNTLEWCREGINKQIDNLQNVPIVNYSEWVEHHRNGELVKVADVSKVTDPALKSLMESQGIKSLLTLPMMIEKECLGFVGFDSVRYFHDYTDYEHQLLQVYAQTLVNARERLEKEKRLVEAKEKAEESDRLKSSFLANMSHEIRTPMNGILGFLELLKIPDLSEENKTNYIDIVTKSGQRLLATLNDIIEISKIEAGELKVNMTSVNISELMTYFYNFFKPQTDEKGLLLKLSGQVQGKDLMIRTDRNKVESILSNLLKNAVKFTTKGVIEFGNYFEESNIVFFVKDTGSGIHPDRVNVIFDRFVQGDMSNSRIYEGSGLGLSIVKAYSEMMGGKIWLESVTDKGSCFYISLPYVNANEQIVEDQKEKHLQDSDQSGKTFLIVEDDFASFQFLEKVLTQEKIKIVHTINGEDAVRIARENNSLSIILMDIKIPGISGIEATRRIREFNKTIPIIAQTAYAFSSDKELVIEAGCNDYIAKPINRNDLMKLIRKYSGTI
jgi:PAS domain S-box-containing protein